MKYRSLQLYHSVLLVLLLPLLAKSQSRLPIDHHVHFFSPELADDIRKQGYALTVPDSMITDVDFILKVNRADRLVLISGGYAYSQSVQKTRQKDRRRAVEAENDLLAEYVRQYPKRLLGFYGLNPLEKFALKEMKRCHEELQLQGLKLHFHGSGINMRAAKHRKKLRKIFEYAAGEDIPVLLHFKNDLKDFGPGDARLFISEILDRLPPLTIIFAHMGGDGGFTRETKAVLAAFADYFEKGKTKHHLYFELSGVVVYRDMDYPGKLPYEELTRLIRRIGPKRVLFGSDYPVMPSSMYQKLLKEYLPLKETEWDYIFHNSPFFSDSNDDYH
jgi:predicted TIM-barrel fold metal-dependent hydrolase